jgi:8-amino-7-oxononanoate synthase
VTQLPWQAALQRDLSERQAAGRYRQNRQRVGEQGVHVHIDGRPMLSFCSNDYLGLASHPAIKQRFIDVIESDGAGSGAAHLLTGHSTHHQALEEALADFTGQPRALLFSTGYMANMGVIDALVGRGDVVIQDKWNHASLLDGARLSDADMMRYPHVDMAQLHKRLHQSAAFQRKLIVTDGVFSMDGDIAPLPEIMAIAKQHQAAVMVDDAHGIGVIGLGGRGSVSHFELSGDAQPIIVGTLGKALGTAGAFVAADEVVIETLTQHARPYVYTTAQPAAIAAATLKSLEVLEKESWRHEQLEANIALFRSGAHALGLKLMASETPIQPIIVGDDQLTLTLGQQLEEKGILVGVIRTPTVPKNTARLRVTISAAHTEADIQQLLTALEQVHAS